MNEKTRGPKIGPLIPWLVVLLVAGFNAQTLPAAAPAPRVRFDQTVIPPDVPPQVLIGEAVTFRVRFKNSSSTALMGYGPFIDVVLDAGGANITKPPHDPPCPCDGMTFVQANVIQVNGGPVPLVSHPVQAPCTPSATKVPLTHPFAAAGVAPVMVGAGSQLVAIELPFGSFDPTQPEVVVEVTVNVSNLEDAGAQLKIYARGGFRFGATPLNDAPPDWPVLSDVVTPGNPPSNQPSNQQTDSTLWAANEQTTATVIIVKKKYSGAEDETAMGPNFMRRYEITVDIANGQTIQALTVTDRLPGNMAYHAMVPTTTPCFLPPFTAPVPDVAHGGSANWLVWKCNSITGAPGPDAAIAFEFFIPQFDDAQKPVLPLGACDAESVNDVLAEGDWTPVDVCDVSPAHVVSDVTAADHTLTAKCLAIQKTVVDVNGAPPAHPIPGDTLLYTLNFQISDFKTVGSLKVQDLLSDGQTVLPASLTLTVTDQCGTASGPIAAFDWSQTSVACVAGELSPRKLLDINVSDAMFTLVGTSGQARHQFGILTGGHTFTPTSTVPATGTITFQTVIDDAYQCPVASPHDLFVDKDDPLVNAVRLTGQILSNGGPCSDTAVPLPTGIVGEDFSGIEVFIASGILEKTVYAVRRGGAEICGPNTTACAPKPDVFPGDEVTFRLMKTIPSGDAESLKIQDWLPLPTFVVAGGTFNNVQCGLPAPGNSCLGPGNTLAVAPPPIFTPDALSNSITFDYGTFNDPANQAQTIVLLFTGVVTNTPSADGLYATNEAGECESDTFGVTYCQAAIAQVHVRQPALRITKGVVAANTSNAVFSPAQAGPVTFNAPGTSCQRFNGTINSTNLASSPINSNISNVDSLDCVTFAIVVENRGGSPAYDIKLHDLFPLDSASNLECFDPNFATLCVTDGAGTPIPFTAGSGFLNGNNPITLQNPLPGLSSNGSNIAVITFDACVIKEIKPHCCDNTANVESYASTPGGPSFVGAGLGGPFQDTAQLCVLPRASKLVKTTSEAHTPGTPSGPPISPEQLAIGEIIRYRLEVVVPESVSPNSYQLQDLLPAGLSYLTGTATMISISGGVTASQNPPLVTGPAACPGGGSLLFDFGTVTNVNNNPAQELIVLEFNALVCNAAANQSGATRNNSFGVLVNGQQVATSNTVAAVVVEPNITIAKVAAVPSLSVGATVVYTITLANNGTATAFDMGLTDSLPACLTNLSSIQVSSSGGVTGITNGLLGTDLLVGIGVMPVNGTVTVQYSATLSCLDCSRLTNTAKVEWTSLPGVMGTTTNPTNSAIPGTSGFPDGEREFGGGVNDYVGVASASLCCMRVSSPTISCDKSGAFTYTFTVTNDTNATVPGVTITPISPANTTITPGLTAVSLAPGASATVTVTFAGPGVVSGAQSCFSVELMGAAGAACRIEQCITLPVCCAPPPPQMVAWYPLDEAQGAAVNDVASSPGSSVNNVGTPKPGPPGASPKPVTGQVSGALYFTGVPYVEVPSQSDLNFNAGSFSIDAWVRAVGCGPGQLSPIVDKLDTGNNTGFAFYLDQPVSSSAVLKLQVNASTFTSTGTIAATANPVLNTGPWFHIAVTVNTTNGVGTFYINGLPAGTFSTPSGPMTNTVPMWIGQTRIPGSRCEIAIDELEIFNRALTQAELQSISDAGSGGKCRIQEVLPRAAKLIKTTSEAHTPGTPSGAPLAPEQLAVGEIVRYRLEVEVPDPTSSSSYKIQDFLPAGLSYVSPSTTITTMSAGLTASNSPPLVTGGPFTCNGAGPTLDFGNVTNSNNSAAPELIVVEFNALVCNTAANQDGTTLNNNFVVLVNGLQAATSNTVTAVVVEPNITITKTAAAPSLTAGAAVNYTITLANNGTATALDVQLTDALPACLTGLTNVQINTSGGVTGITNASTNTLNVTIASIPVNGTVTVQYSASLKCVDCSQLTNNASVTWTDLPGSAGTSPNPTGYSTPGTSGLAGGERDGSGGVNDYAAVASASLCCMRVSRESITCDKAGTFAYTFTVTNLSSSPISGISFAAVSPANTTVTPGFIATPLASGASTVVTVIVGGSGAVSGASFCFRATLVGAGGAAVCRTEQCITLPRCCVEPPTEMVAWYPLDEAAKTDVNDIAPSPGSTVNNVGTQMPGAGGNYPTSVAGKVNGALYFDGPYVEVPSHADLNLGGEGFSIDAWVIVDKCDGAVFPIVDKLDREQGYAFYIEQSPLGGALLKLRINGTLFTGGSIAVGTGQWIHVAVTVRVGSVSAFFIDGSLAGTFAMSTAPALNSVPLWIGRTRLETHPCAIAIDELELFNRGIREDEIRSIFTAGSGGKCRVGGTICVTKFEDLNRSGRQDSGEPLLPGWIFNVTDQNNILVGTISTYPPGMPPGCLKVNGSGTYTITEQVQPGWTSTTQNPQTVTVLPGQTVNLTFGNWHLRRRRAVSINSLPLSPRRVAAEGKVKLAPFVDLRPLDELPELMGAAQRHEIASPRDRDAREAREPRERYQRSQHRGDYVPLFFRLLR